MNTQNQQVTEQVIMMPRRQLRESPSNPRTHYNEASLLEMAATMKKPHGRIHSPLVVRPLLQGDIEHTHEIVFGHRRNRSAGLAELDDVPVIVREMSDEEVRVAQLIENAQREDVTPLEEADSLNELRHKHGLSIEELMKRTGKSRSYVFAALRLATASDELREAAEAGIAKPEVAKLLATLPNPLQAKALKEVSFDSWHEGKTIRQTQSFRNVKNIVDQRYRLKLADAPFDTLSMKLLPNTLACDACPKRSDREPVMLEQCGPDVCTDPDCFAAKTTAHVDQAVKAAKKRGQPVVGADGAKKLLNNRNDNAPTGYTVLERSANIKSLAGKDLSYGDLLENATDAGKASIAPTLIVHPHRPGVVLECITDAQADALLNANGSSLKEVAAAEEEANTPNWLKAQRDRDAEREARRAAMSPEDRAVDGAAWTDIKLAIIRRVADTQRSVEELRMMVLTELHHAGDFGSVEKLLGWVEPEDDEDDNQELNWRMQKVNALSADQLAQLLVMVAIDSGAALMLDRDNLIAGRRKLAAMYGVDVLNPTGAGSTPSVAARCAEGATEENIPDLVVKAGAPTPEVPKLAGTVKYCNPMTGETWSGRGLMPKWLWVAVSDGKRLEDFAAPTPSAAAQAPKGGAKADAPGVGLAADEFKSRGLTPAAAGGAKAKGGTDSNTAAGGDLVDQMVDAGSAGAATATANAMEAAGA